MNLDNVKVGDYIAARVDYRERCLEVKRVTAATVYTSGPKFRKSDGRSIGLLPYDTTYARPASDLDLVAMRVRAADAALANYTVTPANLEKVERFLTS